MTADTKAEKLPILHRSIVLVGMMGAGKTAIGRRLATVFDLPFIDADEEIETAAGCPITDIFALHGEAAFRDGERRVIKRLLKQPPFPPAHSISKHSSVWITGNLNSIKKSAPLEDWLAMRQCDGHPATKKPPGERVVGIVRAED
jgi:hypothetical protein